MLRRLLREPALHWPLVRLLAGWTVLMLLVWGVPYGITWREANRFGVRFQQLLEIKQALALSMPQLQAKGIHIGSDHWLLPPPWQLTALKVDAAHFQGGELYASVIVQSKRWGVHVYRKPDTPPDHPHPFIMDTDLLPGA